ncbi:hypothetical protein [Hymenobacter koreensis]|uniref:Uncharacterized protein n=1 Tax=Hymenobacter koreensis TaxID=1084523 RepID=A0ABP8IZI6_9BACT
MEVPRIHLIEKQWLVQPNADEPGVLESGFWKHIEPQVAERLIGGKIYFHLKQQERAYASGRIVGYRHALENERIDSIVFLFRPDDPVEPMRVQSLNWEPTNLRHINVYPYRQIIL